jgi:hypothetical protein
MARYSEKFGRHRTQRPQRITLDTLSNEVEFGLMPIGSVISVMSSTPGAYSHPGGGTVDEGLMLCDGVTVIPRGPMAGQTVPGLDNDTYLRGSAASGAAGGANDKIIPAAALPEHTHGASTITANTPHPHPGSPNGTHDVPHSHTQRMTWTGFPPLFNPGGRRDRNDTSPGSIFDQGINTGPAHTQSYPGAPPTTTLHTHPGGGTGAHPMLHGHGITVNPAGTGSPINTLNVEPEYLTTIYAIRIT